MYQLGDQFLLNNDNKLGNKNNTFIGEKYRITVLSERLIRFEYSNTGEFNDNYTSRVINRKFPDFSLSFKEDKNYLEIVTSYFKIEYQKNKPFSATSAYPTANLRVTILGNEKRWYYGSPEVKNYGGGLYSLDDENVLNFKGLYSIDGFAALDETYSYVYDDNGVLIPKKNNGIDVYLFAYNNDFVGCLKDYFTLTGEPELIPRYALGNWWSKNKEYNLDKIKKLLTKFKTEKIPISVFLFDKTWYTKFFDSKNNILDFGYTVNRKLFEPFDIKKLFDNYNIHYGLNVDPSYGLSKYEEFYPKVSEYLQNTSEIIPFDIMNPKWLDVYFKVVTHSLEKYGFSIFWNDYKPKTNNLNKLFMLNHYQYKDLTRINKNRSLILSRNTNVAPHRYPVTYSGRTIVSFDTLKKLPDINMSFSNMGVSFISHDIGGFHYGREDSELYLRYIQFGVFSSILRFSSENGKYYKKEPWKNDFKTVEVTKKYLNLRYKLIPYIYSEIYKYRINAIPLVKPLYYDLPDMYFDPVNKNEYFFGTELIVSPIVDKKDFAMNRVIQRFFLPKGVWYDFFNGKKYIGNIDYISFYNDEEYPVFVKEGGIVILNNDDIDNKVTNPNSLEINIFPGKSNSYNLYEDDGITDRYKEGYYLITNFDYSYENDKYTLIIRPIEGKTSTVPEKRNYTIRFKNVRMPDGITIYSNDQLISPSTYVDDNDYVVEINDISTNNQITISCTGKDMILDNLRVINEEIDSIISDIPIDTLDKEKINYIMFGDLPINKKRIQIKKLKIEKIYKKLFIRLLEYVEVNV